MNSCKTITDNLRSLVSKGKELYLIFKEERSVKCTMAFTEPVKKHSMLLPGDKEKLPSLVVGLTSSHELALIQEVKDVVSDRFDEAVEAFIFEPFNGPGAFTKHEDLALKPLRAPYLKDFTRRHHLLRKQLSQLMVHLLLTSVSW